MEKCEFTFRAEIGTPTVEFPSQTADRAEKGSSMLTLLWKEAEESPRLKFDFGAAVGAPKCSISHPKSRASPALALRPKSNADLQLQPLTSSLISVLKVVQRPVYPTRLLLTSTPQGKFESAISPTFVYHQGPSVPNPQSKLRKA